LPELTRGISCHLDEGSSAGARFDGDGTRAAFNDSAGRRSDIMADVEEPRGASGAVGTPERDGLPPNGRDPKSNVAPSAPKSHTGRAKSQSVTHLTPNERAAVGKAARAVAPRAAHGEWEPAPDRRDPVDLLEEQAASRLQELVPVRYGRMLVSPFTFFRGAAYPMAADLADAPRTGLHVQLCGDAHLSNFGAFAASDRRLVFSINDFDETLPGPFEWDVKRLVASFAVAGRDRGFSSKQRRSVNLAVTRSYREAITKLADQPTLDIWYGRMDVDEIRALAAQQGTPKQLRRFERNVAKARSKDSLKALGKLTTTVDGERRIVSDPPLIVPIEEIASGAEGVELDEFLHGAIRSYRRTLTADRRQLLERFRYAHAARKVVGVGSVGTRAWIVLMLGRDASDPLFLQLKQAEASVLEPFLDKSACAQHGQRVVEGQRLTQAASDIMLGWIRIPTPEGTSVDFYIRQLWDGKGSAVIETMNPSAMAIYAQICGHALAMAHARSGDAIAIASYLGRGDSFDRALASFAEAYADQNERDYTALTEAVASGRIAAETGL
jgi:Uncharacterized protein conserved in bacteria (DUF2252)